MPDYSEYADAALLERGRRLLEQNALAITSSRQDSDGFLRLRGRSTDPFNFVDHPALLLGPDGKIRDFRCDCGEGRRGAFCVHCAALALKGETDRLQVKQAAAAAPAMKNAGPAQGEILQYSFSFSNSNEDLYQKSPLETACLSEKSFIAMFGNNLIEKEIYRQHREFGGICYGMAAANSIFNWPGDETPPSDFRKEALQPYDLPLQSTHREWAMALLEYLEILYLSQLSPETKTISKPTVESLDQYLRRLCSLITGYREGRNPLPCIGVSKSTSAEYMGHELLPYRVDEDGAGPFRIAIYDCNYPGEERYILFNRGQDGKIISWSYEMGGHGVWLGNGEEECEYELDYVEHDSFRSAFDNRPVPLSELLGRGLFMAKNKLTVRNADQAEVLKITENGFRAADPSVMIRKPKTLKGTTPMVYMPSGSYSVDVWDGEMTEVTVSFTTLENRAEIRTDADEFSFEVNDEGQICSVTIPVAERTYYVTITYMGEEGQQEVRLEGITGYETLRFGQIRHTLYVEGINERTQQDLYVNGTEASLDLLTRGFPREEKQEQKKPERELLYNFPAEDPSGDEN